MNIADLKRLLSPLHTRIVNLAARATLSNIDDKKKLQTVQIGVLDGETKDDVERFQNYGFTSVPVAGAECVAVFVGGKRDHGLVIAIDDRRYRLVNLESGEVAVYDKTGSTIVFKKTGDIEVTPSSGLVKFTGDVNVSGTLTATTDVVGGGKSLKGHKHGAAGSVAAAPGPVTFVPVASTDVPL